MNDAVIVAAVRTPIGKAPNGRLRHARPDDLAATVMTAALARVPALDPNEIEDVVFGCAMPEAEQGLNVARIASLRAGLPVSASAATINRFCASGLEAIAIAAGRDDREGAPGDVRRGVRRAHRHLGRAAPHPREPADRQRA